MQGLDTRPSRKALKTYLQHSLSYECGDGRIGFDSHEGHDSRNLPKSWLFHHVGYLTLENSPFDASVRGLPRPRPTLSQRRGVRAGDAGRNGYRDRHARRAPGRRGLSIARSLPRFPPIPLLGQATLAIVNEAERLIQDALRQLRRYSACLATLKRPSAAT